MYFISWKQGGNEGLLEDAALHLAPHHSDSLTDSPALWRDQTDQAQLLLHGRSVALVPDGLWRSWIMGRLFIPFAPDQGNESSMCDFCQRSTKRISVGGFRKVQITASQLGWSCTVLGELSLVCFGEKKRRMGSGERKYRGLSMISGLLVIENIGRCPRSCLPYL